MNLFYILRNSLQLISAYRIFMTLNPNHIYGKCEIVLVSAHDDFFLSYLPNYVFMLSRNTLYSAVQYTKYL
jgi:hypothetical protein